MDRERISRLINFSNEEGPDTSTGFTPMSDISVRTFIFDNVRSYLDFVFNTIADNLEDCYDEETGELYKKPYVSMWLSGGGFGDDKTSHTTYNYQALWTEQEGPRHYITKSFYVRFDVPDVDNNEWDNVFKTLDNKIKWIRGPYSNKREKEEESFMTDILEYILDNTTRSGDRVSVTIDRNEINI